MPIVPLACISRQWNNVERTPPKTAPSDAQPRGKGSERAGGLVVGLFYSDCSSSSLSGQEAGNVGEHMQPANSQEAHQRVSACVHVASYMHSCVASLPHKLHALPPFCSPGSVCTPPTTTADGPIVPSIPALSLSNCLNPLQPPHKPNRLSPRPPTRHTLHSTTVSRCRTWLFLRIFCGGCFCIPIPAPNASAHQLFAPLNDSQSCPTDCIKWVDADHLASLEYMMQVKFKDERVDVHLLMKGDVPKVRCITL